MKARTSICEAAQADPKRASRMPRRFFDSDAGAEVRLCIPDDQLAHLPPCQPVPTVWPKAAPLPRVGEVIYLTSTSAWVVRIVVHEFLPGGALRREVWLDWIGAARHARVAEANFVH